MLSLILERDRERGIFNDTILRQFSSMRGATYHDRRLPAINMPLPEWWNLPVTCCIYVLLHICPVAYICPAFVVYPWTCCNIYMSCFCCLPMPGHQADIVEPLYFTLLVHTLLPTLGGPFHHTSPRKIELPPSIIPLEIVSIIDSCVISQCNTMC
jgi:hypothetical protein